eukprot:scaffold91096_cov62-Phaeocystis_antarctica.AAC.5
MRPEGYLPRELIVDEEVTAAALAVLRAHAPTDLVGGDVVRVHLLPHLPMLLAHGVEGPQQQARAHEIRVARVERRLAALVPVQHPADEVTQDRVPRRRADEGRQEDATCEYGVLAVGRDVVRHGKGRDEARLREDELAHLGSLAHVEAALELRVKDEATRLEQRRAAAERAAVHVARLVPPVAHEPWLHLLQQQRAGGVVVEDHGGVLVAVELDGVLCVGAQCLIRTLQLLLLGLQQVEPMREDEQVWDLGRAGLLSRHLDGPRVGPAERGGSAHHARPEGHRLRHGVEDDIVAAGADTELLTDAEAQLL